MNKTKIKGGCQSGRKVVTHNSKSDLPLAPGKGFAKKDSWTLSRAIRKASEPGGRELSLRGPVEKTLVLHYTASYTTQCTTQNVYSFGVVG